MLTDRQLGAVTDAVHAALIDDLGGEGPWCFQAQTALVCLLRRLGHTRVMCAHGAYAHGAGATRHAWVLSAGHVLDPSAGQFGPGTPRVSTPADPAYRACAVQVPSAGWTVAAMGRTLFPSLPALAHTVRTFTPPPPRSGRCRLVRAATLPA